MVAHYPFLFLLLFVSVRVTTAQELSPDLTLAYRKLLEFKTDSVNHILERPHGKAHDLAFKIYIRSLEKFLRLMISVDDSLYQQYPDFEKACLDDLGPLEGDDPFVIFVKGEIRLHAGIIRYRYGDFLTAGLRFMQASGQVRSLLKLPEPPVYVYKTSGILNILLSLVPDRYNFLMKLFGLNADLSQGISQLEELVEKENLFRFEGTMVLAFLNAYYLDQPAKSSSAIAAGYDQWRSSLLYRFLSGLIFTKIRMNDKALSAFSDCLEFPAAYDRIPSTRFYLAETFLQKLDLAGAEIEYKKFLADAQTDDFDKTANYRLYLINLLQHDSLSAEKFRLQVLNSGRLFMETDKYVYTLVKNDYRPHTGILKARLLFDGGYYGESLSMLGTIATDSLSDEEKLEYLYRKARVYQLLKEYTRSMDYFHEMFSFGTGDHYLIASAHLQMGYIELERKNMQESAFNFREAMQYSGEYYRNSIRNEARAGLRLVEQEAD